MAAEHDAAARYSALRDAANLREAVAEVSKTAAPFDSDWWASVRLVCTAALDSLTQRELVGEMSRAMAELKQDYDRLRFAVRKADSDAQELREKLAEAQTRELMVQITQDELRSELEAANQRTVIAREARDQIRDDRDQLQRELEAARAERDREEKRAGMNLEGWNASEREVSALRTQLSTAQADAQRLREALRPFAARLAEIEEIGTVRGRGDECETPVKFGLLRDARAALGAGGEEGR